MFGAEHKTLNVEAVNEKFDLNTVVHQKLHVEKVTDPFMGFDEMFVSLLLPPH